MDSCINPEILGKIAYLHLLMRADKAGPEFSEEVLDYSRELTEEIISRANDINPNETESVLRLYSQELNNNDQASLEETNIGQDLAADSLGETNRSLELEASGSQESRELTIPTEVLDEMTEEIRQRALKNYLHQRVLKKL